MKWTYAMCLLIFARASTETITKTRKTVHIHLNDKCMHIYKSGYSCCCCHQSCCVLHNVVGKHWLILTLPPNPNQITENSHSLCVTHNAMNFQLLRTVITTEVTEVIMTMLHQGDKFFEKHDKSCTLLLLTSIQQKVKMQLWISSTTTAFPIKSHSGENENVFCYHNENLLTIYFAPMNTQHQQITPLIVSLSFFTTIEPNHNTIAMEEKPSSTFPAKYNFNNIEIHSRCNILFKWLIVFDIVLKWCTTCN